MNPKNILYFSFDEVLATKPDIIDEVLENYQKITSWSSEEINILIDEVQYVENWEAVIKRYYDLYQKIKFFVSGSASLQIKKAKESLVGRLYEFVLTPLTFRDFLQRKGMQLPGVVDEFDFKTFETTQPDLLLYKNDIEILLNEYMIKGGFPEILDERSIEKIHKYLRTNTDRIIFKDI